MAHAAVTEVLRVRGGDEIELAQQRYEPAWWRREHFENCPGGYGTCEPGVSFGLFCMSAVGVEAGLLIMSSGSWASTTGGH